MRTSRRRGQGCNGPACSSWLRGARAKCLAQRDRVGSRSPEAEQACGLGSNEQQRSQPISGIPFREGPEPEGRGSACSSAEEIAVSFCATISNAWTFVNSCLGNSGVQKIAYMAEFDWNDLRAFLAVVRTGRLVAAAHQLGIDHSTLSRRIGGLEKEGSASAPVRPEADRLHAHGHRREPGAASRSHREPDDRDQLSACPFCFGTGRLGAHRDARGVWNLLSGRAPSRLGAGLSRPWKPGSPSCERCSRNPLQPVAGC